MASISTMSNQTERKAMKCLITSSSAQHVQTPNKKGIKHSFLLSFPEKGEIFTVQPQRETDRVLKTKASIRDVAFSNRL